MVADFLLPFDLGPLDTLDQYALIACQDYNLGNRGDWFACFRGGIHGLHSRIHAVQRHFYEVHAWIPAPRNPMETEYHVSTILFSMDSAVECVVFALNGLGWAVAPGQFLDVTDRKALRRIAPWNIVGENSLPGYSTYFPSLQQLWIARKALLQTIADQHDTSKHRTTVFEGGQHRLDAPPGFYEAMGVANDPNRQFMFWPMEEIHLAPDAKAPPAVQQPRNEDWPLLEAIAEEFCVFINESGVKAFEDATSKIILPNPRLQRPTRKP